MSCQDADGALLQHPPHPKSPYVHGASALLLAEVYGMTSDGRASRIRHSIEKAITYTRHMQIKVLADGPDIGGWRYYGISGPMKSDLSSTSWQLMFLRSAKAAGFRVENEWIEEAIDYIGRCYIEERDSFGYGSHSGDRFRMTHGLAGSGILAFAMAGKHETRAAKQAGRWLLDRPMFKVGQAVDRFYYACFYCSQAMFQLGGDYWNAFYPPLVQRLLSMQQSQGQWDKDSPLGQEYGETLVTAFAILALTTPNQVLPVLQR